MEELYDFVIDYETMATRPDTVALCCAITRFPRNGIPDWDKMIEETLYLKFDTAHQIDDGRVIDKDTMNWWAKQPEELRERLLVPKPYDISLREFVQQLKDFFVRYPAQKNSILYCRGSEFDHPITASIIRQYGSDIMDEKFKPVPFWNRTCVRSYVAGLMVDPNVSKVPFRKGLMKEFQMHDPIHDNLRAAFHVRMGEAYARGDEEMPEGDDVDPASLA